MARPGRLPTVLLTGFEAFGADPVNPSWVIAARLDGWQVRQLAAEGPLLAVVRSVRLPCVFGEALAVLDDALERHRPVAVIALGLAASRPEISVERVAVNIDDARIPDNAGRQPIDRPVCAEGPVAYWSTLPVKAIVAAMREAGIDAAVSQSAGTFVCNHVFYGLAHRLADGAAHGKAPDGQGFVTSGSAGAAVPACRGGFIHVPWPRAGLLQGPADAAGDDAGKAPAGRGRAAVATAATAGLGPAEPATVSDMSLDTLVAAIRIAVRVTLAAGDADLNLPGGTIA